MRPRCKHCRKRIKWIETDLGWRVFDWAKQGPYRAHVCDKKDLPEPVNDRRLVDPWWNRD